MKTQLEGKIFISDTILEVLSSIQAGEIPLHSNDIITNGEILYSFNV